MGLFVVYGRTIPCEVKGTVGIKMGIMDRGGTIMGALS